MNDAEEEGKLQQRAARILCVAAAAVATQRQFIYLPRFDMVLAIHSMYISAALQSKRSEKSRTNFKSNEKDIVKASTSYQKIPLQCRIAVVSNEKSSPGCCCVQQLINLSLWQKVTPGRMIHERCSLCCHIYAISGTNIRVNLSFEASSTCLFLRFSAFFLTRPSAPYLIGQLRTRWDAPADVTWRIIQRHHI